MSESILCFTRPEFHAWVSFRTLAPTTCDGLQQRKTVCGSVWDASG